MFVLANMWFQTLMRQFFFNVDKIVYSFISKIYDLLITIARTSILSQADILDMADRIYKLLAVFMVFKVTFSLIMYVVNPDDFSDKSKGVGKLGTNIVISLALLILTPYIFNYSYQLQTIILEDNSLAALIFGDDKKSSNSFASAGDSMAYITMSPFFTVNISINELQDCIQLTTKNSENVVFNDDCSNSLKNLTTDNENFTETTLNNYINGVNVGNLNLMFRQDLAVATDKDKENYIMDYNYIFSTVLGVIVVLLLLTFCLDVAVRSIKLAFLQLIAPIPIISYVDPKSGKDGLFKKWYKMCFSTYISLFIRLLAIYFAAYIISRIDNMVDIIDGSYVSNSIVKIFIIIGALMFAKQLPKMLEGLGFKLDGGFTLNPLRKIEKDALGGQILKKPNDMLARAGKGLVMSPINGMGTVGKKFIGGVDAARNGKGFKQGWNRTHGKLYNNFYKKLDEWAPDSAEARKNERLGREEVKAMNTRWTRGKAAADKLSAYAQSHAGLGVPANKPFDLLNGRNKDAYRQIYSSEEFIESRMNLDAKDEERKILQRISEATMRGIKVKEAIDAEIAAIDKVGGAFKTKMDALKRITNDAEATTKFAKTLDDTTKAVSGMEKVHESIRKQNQADAVMEDSLKFVKYNPTDPTDPGNPERRSGY